MRNITSTVVASLSLLGLAACASASGQPARAGHSAPHPTTTISANVQACQDFAKQVIWLKQRRATVTLMDVATFGGWLQMDAGNSTGRLHSDISALSSIYQTDLGGGSVNGKPAMQRVRADCSALGVSIVKPGR
jgi:hypothetical protein